MTYRGMVDLMEDQKSIQQLKRRADEALESVKVNGATMGLAGMSYCRVTKVSFFLERVSVV